MLGKHGKLIVVAHGCNGVLFPEKLLFLNMDLHPQFESQPRDSISKITGIHLDLSLELSITIHNYPIYSYDLPMFDT